MANRQIIQALEQRQQSLTKIIHKAERWMLQAPPGSIEVKKHGKGVQFYLRSNTNEKHGKYVRAADRKRVKALAQKRYLTRVLDAARTQQKAIDAFLRSYDPQVLERIYEAEGLVRQSLIDPVEIPDLEYERRWLAVAYKGKGFSDDMPLHYTMKQERVRSKSEVLIANALARAGVPYKYECPLVLNGHYIVHPDFTILRLRDRNIVYWEHLGLLDDPEYLTKAIYKLLRYEENGIFLGENLIISAESYHVPLNEVTIQRLIKHYILDDAA